MIEKGTSSQKNDDYFNQKKINHIVHYNDNFETVLKIIKNGFAPSYCKETIGDNDYYIPMVSFCNIPLRDANLYMRYGKYGIGMSLSWALSNSISPVVYIHESTPFRNLHFNINKIHLSNLAGRKLLDTIQVRSGTKSKGDNFDNDIKLIAEINKITVPTIQFFKNWKTIYKQKEIITYQEREWRYIPTLDNATEKALISKTDIEFTQLKNKKFKSKPHLPEYVLKIDDINDLRYIIINTDKQRDKILSLLNYKFGIDEVNKSIVSGNLLILKHDTIHNDF
jgi:hypothetical protein